MTLSNNQFQIFFNKSPIFDQEKASPLVSSVKLASKPAEQTTKFNLSFGGVYQSSSFVNNSAPFESQNIPKPAFVNEAFRGNSTSNFEQVPASSFHGQFSPLNTNLYAEETFDYDDLKSSTPIYSDDAEEQTGSMLDQSSRKIKKDRMSLQFKPTGNKKAMQEDLKIKTKRNPWQPEEDEQVLELVTRYGQSWALIASLMKERSGKQIRDRYLNKLKPDINKGEWAQSEDDLLMSLCRQIGHKWSRIATYLPGRTEGQVKNRFYSHIKKRMGKWTGPAGEGIDAEENSGSNDEFDGEGGLMTNVKEETLSFGSDHGPKNPPKSIQTFNCAGDYQGLSQLRQREGKVQSMGFSSLSIKVEGINQTGFVQKKEQVLIPQKDKKCVTYNFSTSKMNPKSMDPTDVISYSMIGSTEDCSTAEEVKSPISGMSNGFGLSSTRASSLNQGKEFDETYDRMASLLTNNMTSANLVKPSTISFSISNGNISQNKNIITRKVGGFQEPMSPLNRMVKLGTPLMGVTLKNLSQMDFSGAQSKVDVRTY